MMDIVFVGVMIMLPWASYDWVCEDWRRGVGYFLLRKVEVNRHRNRSIPWTFLDEKPEEKATALVILEEDKNYLEHDLVSV